MKPKAPDAAATNHPPCLCARMPEESCAWPECNLGREHRQDAVSRNNAATIAAPESCPPTFSDNLARSHVVPSDPVVPTAVEEEFDHGAYMTDRRIHRQQRRKEDADLARRLEEALKTLMIRRCNCMLNGDMKCQQLLDTEQRAEAAERKLEEARDKIESLRIERHAADSRLRRVVGIALKMAAIITDDCDTVGDIPDAVQKIRSLSPDAIIDRLKDKNG